MGEVREARKVRRRGTGGTGGQGDGSDSVYCQAVEYTFGTFGHLS